MKLRPSRAFGTGCFTLIPLLFIAVGGAWLFFSIQRVSNQTTASGVIVDIATSRDSDGTTYRPVIEFVASDGVTYRIEGRTGTSSRPRVGDMIDVLYDPADPRGATERTFTNLWLFPLAFGGFGLLFLALMSLGRRRNITIGQASRGRALDGEEAAEVLDKVLDRMPDVGPSGPADAGPLRNREETYSPSGPRTPVGGTTAEFRRAEASISPDGTIHYRIVAKDEAGNEYYSDLLETDPTVAIMEQGNEVELVPRRNGWVVEFHIPEDD